MPTGLLPSERSDLRAHWLKELSQTLNHKSRKGTRILLISILSHRIQADGLLIANRPRSQASTMVSMDAIVDKEDRVRKRPTGTLGDWLSQHRDVSIAHGPNRSHVQRPSLPGPSHC